MRIKLINLGIIVGCLVCASSSALAVNVGVRASTLGLGVEATQSLHPNLNARFGLNRFSYTYDAAESGVDYAADLKLQTVGALLDWHPFAGSFRMSGGFLFNQNKVELRSKLQESFDIGNQTYTSDASDPLKLDGNIEFQPITPYLGLGWGSSPNKKSGLSLSAEIGVVFLGKPSVNLEASGSVTDSNNTSVNVANYAEFQENLNIEANDLQNQIDKFQYYPVVSLGFIVAF